MSAILSLVSSFCMQTPGSYNDACHSAIDAGGRQSGVTKDLNEFEKHAEKHARLVAEDQLGQEGSEILVGSAIVINAAATQRFIVNLPTYGLCDSFKTEYRPSLYKLSFQWNF